MKEIFGIIGTAFMMGGFAPYLLALYNRKAKPHAFSWLLWGTINGIVFVVQMTEKAGPGAWTAGIASFFCLSIGFYATRHGERNITQSDWIIFIGALAAIPLWAATKDPVWAVILVSIIDTLAFIPTLRKSWHRPHEEVTVTFALGAIGFVWSLMALESYSFVNICYPAKVIIINSVFILIVLYRRRVISQLQSASLQSSS